MTITISVPFALPPTLVRAARALFPVLMPLALALVGTADAGVGLVVGLEIGLAILRHLLGP
ncbi:hypothetical protein DI270_005350 [Microbispora triticiradicis]|uniref:Uncharacterized protein n=3 Tax=Microbispora TaxID=2005 RepID=A0ABY3M196_9ACTN|nr:MULTISPECIES: hypothetical protein [Microbispora]RGA06049.1 hypothetical protein DI270_005350 [Microbispora triticiradicis]TLP52791.1 hypothetical protein FED44_30780 [Microbispora fusca]TYB62867.1 hypothetical protein FXF59_09355 [Microbispora tritici]GLW24463.1 hypothetical protein Mame01_45060 [Microbispora amethystogenes]